MNRRLKIGIGKVGFVINEKRFVKPQGGMIEIIALYKILSLQHDVYIVSTLDKKSELNRWNGEELDFMFIFNGCISKYNNVGPTGKDALIMFKNYSYPTIKFINEHPVPYVFLWDDIRFPIWMASELQHQPSLTVSGYSDPKMNVEYGHFDKLYLYQRQLNYDKEKKFQFGTLINNTNGQRTKLLKKFVEYLGHKGWNVDVQGDMPADFPFNDKPLGLLEGNTFEWLQYLKYTININVEKRAFSRKFWEFLVSDVICFIHHYDEEYNGIPKNSFLRVKDYIQLNERMKYLEDHPENYAKLIRYQRDMILPSYLDGTFMLEFLNTMMGRFIK